MALRGAAEYDEVKLRAIRPRGIRGLDDLRLPAGRCQLLTDGMRDRLGVAEARIEDDEGSNAGAIMARPPLSRECRMASEGGCYGVPDATLDLATRRP